MSTTSSYQSFLDAFDYIDDDGHNEDSESIHIFEMMLDDDLELEEAA